LPIDLDVAIRYSLNLENNMKQDEPRIRIELTNEQKQQIKAVSGEEVTALEFTAQELEERVAPLKFSK
jgi:hypothetical protein